jgi:hypothetical protein
LPSKCNILKAADPTGGESLIVDTDEECLDQILAPPELDAPGVARRKSPKQKSTPPLLPLPPLPQCKHFVYVPTLVRTLRFMLEDDKCIFGTCRNLTNGVEALYMLHDLNLQYRCVTAWIKKALVYLYFCPFSAPHPFLPFCETFVCSFVRIQSTACEQQKWEALIRDVDANLLISLALGKSCIVYDYGSRHRVTGKLQLNTLKNTSSLKKEGSNKFLFLCNDQLQATQGHFGYVNLVLKHFCLWAMFY